MAGIYLHIPFCRQACHYCNFHFSTSLKYKNDFVAALLKEMELRKDYIAKEPVETIYFGGGTPSLLEASELEAILDGLRSRFPVAADAEITLEANPDDLAGAAFGSGPGVDGPAGTGAVGRLGAWKKAGINRLSIGVQSFFAADLEWMNRAHNAGQASESIRMAQGEGFDNISIDLIYGGPTLPDDHWKYNVDEAIRRGVAHLSCYALTVEPRTALDKMIQQHKKQDVNPDDQARQFLSLMDWTAAAGYEHYEISNFAKPGHRSRHNSSYWQGKSYLGLGPSAHSYNGVSREWNVANNARYIAAMGSDAVISAGAIVEREILTPVQRLNEYIMISLRTMEGCDLGVVAERWGEDVVGGLKGKAAVYIDGKKMIKLDNRLILTREGKLLGDGITAALFWEDKK